MIKRFLNFLTFCAGAVLGSAVVIARMVAHFIVPKRSTVMVSAALVAFIILWPLASSQIEQWRFHPEVNTIKEICETKQWKNVEEDVLWKRLSSATIGTRLSVVEVLRSQHHKSPVQQFAKSIRVDLPMSASISCTFHLGHSEFTEKFHVITVKPTYGFWSWPWW